MTTRHCLALQRPDGFQLFSPFQKSWSQLPTMFKDPKPEMPNLAQSPNHAAYEHYTPSCKARTVNPEAESQDPEIPSPVYRITNNFKILLNSQRLRARRLSVSWAAGEQTTSFGYVYFLRNLLSPGTSPRHLIVVFT